MTTEKFDFIAKEIFVGFACGVGGAVLFSVIASLIYNWLDLFGAILYAIIGGYLGVFMGVGVVGYLFLKKKKRRNEFVKHLLQSFLGLIVGLIGLAMGSLFIFIAILFPLAGAVIGFNWMLEHDEKDSE